MAIETNDGGTLIAAFVLVPTIAVVPPLLTWQVFGLGVRGVSIDPDGSPVVELTEELTVIPPLAAAPWNFHALATCYADPSYAKIDGVLNGAGDAFNAIRVSTLQGAGGGNTGPLVPPIVLNAGAVLPLPVGTLWCDALLIGGGGGGGGVTGFAARGQGAGGGGAATWAFQRFTPAVPATPGNLNCAVGALGAGGVAGTPGAAGGDTACALDAGPATIAPGGSGGQPMIGALVTIDAVNGGAGGLAATLAAFEGRGAPGEGGSMIFELGRSGLGGSSLLGGGGLGRFALLPADSSDGNPATGAGAGGGGAVSSNQGGIDRNGGDGSPGQIIAQPYGAIGGGGGGAPLLVPSVVAVRVYRQAFPLVGQASI